MKQIVCLFQGGQQIDILQCLRCMEVFVIATRDTAMLSDRRHVAVALGEQHKAECSKMLVRFDEAENGN